MRLDPVVAHAVDKTTQIEAMGASTIQGPENARAWRCLLGGDRAVLIAYEELTVQPLLDLHLDSGVAWPFHAGQQLQSAPVVFDRVVPGHLAAMFEAEYPTEGHVRIYGPVGDVRLFRRDSELLVEAR